MFAGARRRRLKEKKLKKYFLLALLIGAIPAMAFGQAADCEDCEHQLPVYDGAAGFIATAADGVDTVNYKSTCGNVTRTGQMEANDDGIVNMLLGGDLACAEADGEFVLGPIMDGGWFWMHVGANSAVGNIVAIDVLDNVPTDITDPGDSVDMMPGAGVVLLTHVESGRVGLLPTILPVPEEDPVAVNTCSFTVAASGTQTAETRNCMLGDGGTALAVRGSVDPFTGMRPPLMNGANITRPIAADTTITLEVDLWGNGSGHFDADNPDLGHPGGDALASTITAALPAAGPGGTPPDLSTAGLVFAQDGTTNVGTLTISPEATYCAPSAKPPVNHTAKITFNAAVSSTQAAQVTPAIGDTAGGTDSVATHVINLVCPTPSSQQGVELVPDNLFPTEK